jgi:hypothetical protein
MEKTEIISKELLSEVLNLDYVEVYEIELIGSHMHYTLVLEDDIISDDMTINVHELAHKCKEWAWKTYGHSGAIQAGYILGRFDAMILFNGDGYHFKGDTEPEAIFKACQWILENKDK